MIPRVYKLDKDCLPYKYVVKGSYGIDMVESLGLAIRYWFWHCGIRPKVAFELFRK